MERTSGFVGNGGVRLPIGYRFHPTDEEIIVHYLEKKAFGLPLPASVISEFDVFKVHPNSLPGDEKERHRFFFGKNSRGNFRSKRHVASGYWKPIGIERPILLSECNQIVGLRRTLIFYEPNGSSNNRTATRWFMREYSLVASAATRPFEDWVVYNVFQRQRRAKRKQQRHGGISHRAMNQADEICSKPSSIDLRVHQNDVMDSGSPPPYSPCSSEVTQEVSNGF